MLVTLLVRLISLHFRFLVCMIFYALMDLSHWWPIALSTTGTVAFLIAKVIFNIFLFCSVIKRDLTSKFSADMYNKGAGYFFPCVT